MLYNNQEKMTMEEMSIEQTAPKGKEGIISMGRKVELWVWVMKMIKCRPRPDNKTEEIKDWE